MKTSSGLSNVSFKLAIIAALHFFTFLSPFTLESVKGRKREKHESSQLEEIAISNNFVTDLVIHFGALFIVARSMLVCGFYFYHFKHNPIFSSPLLLRILVSFLIEKKKNIQIPTLVSLASPTKGHKYLFCLPTRNEILTC